MGALRMPFRHRGRAEGREPIRRRLKRWLRDLSLRKSYVLYMLIAMGCR